MFGFTPAPRAQKPPQDVTELVDFMMLGTKENNLERSVHAPKQESTNKNEVPAKTVGAYNVPTRNFKKATLPSLRR